MSSKTYYPPETNTREFIPCPAGLHRAVCCDVVDLGHVETKFGVKPMLRLHFQADKTFEDTWEGETRTRRHVVTKRYTLSLHPKSNLRRDLVSWFSKDLDDAQIRQEGFDFNALVGQPCQVNVVHNSGEYQGEPTVYANIANILPAGDSPIEMDDDYQRVEDRESYEAPELSAFHNPKAPRQAQDVPDMSDVPF